MAFEEASREKMREKPKPSLLILPHPPSSSRFGGHPSRSILLSLSLLAHSGSREPSNTYTYTQ